MEYRRSKIQMKIRFLLFSACYLVLFGTPILAELTETRKNELEALVKIGDMHGGNESDQQPFSDWVLRLSGEERAWLIPIARQHREQIHPSMQELRENWNGLLAYLGDDEAMKMNIENWRNSFGARLEVNRAESGQLPLYFEPELFQEEVYNGPYNRATPSFGVAEIILDYLHYNKHYPQEVRDWAGRTFRNGVEVGDKTPMRKVVRTWYRANEALIRAKQYDKVKSGEELPPRPALLEEAGLNAKLQFRHSSGTKDRDTAPVLKATAGPTVSETERKPAGNYVILAAVTAVLAIVIFFFRNRLTQKKPHL
jgi:hypothetical protein